MQQAYRVLRVVAEAQMIRIVLSSAPDELMLDELCTACAGLNTEGSSGIKAVVMDFQLVDTSVAGAERGAGHPLRVPILPRTLEDACESVRKVSQPLLAVVRGGILSAAACALVNASDLTLVAHDAVLIAPETLSSDRTLTGAQAARLGYVTWSVAAHEMESQLERALAMLREKSAIALRHTKASVRLGAGAHVGTAPGAQFIAPKERLEALKRVNEFYLTKVMQTADAHEGLRAFLEKRKPQWKNR
jgi:enoyl-CoA hydratase/carnithine racemase